MEQISNSYIHIIGNIFFNPVISISDIVAIVTFLSAIAGGIFALKKWSWSVKQKRAEYIGKLTEKVRDNKDIAEVLYMFDYGKEWYSAAFHNGGQIETKIDKTLSFFSYICYLRDTKNITKKEFEVFEYELVRILGNYQVQDYLYNLYHFSHKLKRPMSFTPLLSYGKKRKILDKAFFDLGKSQNTGIYHHYLNY